jgi:hypothetical protein
MKFQKKYIPFCLFILAAAKLLLLKFTPQDVLFLGVLGLLAAFYEFKDNEFKITELKNELADQKAALLRVNDEIDKLKSGITSVKLSQGFRPQVRNNP